MTELKFGLGLRKFNLNGQVEVFFNDTDADFVERLFNIFYGLDEKQSYYEKRVEKMADNKEIFAFMRELDGEIRGAIDDLFNEDVCKPLFGTMNVFALADGLPLWANLMLAVIDQVDTAFAREQKATNPRIQKYTAKWQRK